MDRAYQALSHNPDTRQVVLQIWDSRIDLPQADGTPVDPDIPCNVMSAPKIRDGKLEWLQIIRSNDLFLGVPHNLVQFTCMQEIVAGWLGIECGTYNQVSDSLHVYTHDEAYIRGSLPLTRIACNTDSLSLPREESELAWEELRHRMEQMMAPELGESELKRISRWEAAPQAYQNMLAVLAAEAARRHGWLDVAAGVMTTCTNPAFVELWGRWSQRLEAQ